MITDPSMAITVTEGPSKLISNYFEKDFDITDFPREPTDRNKCIVYR